MPSSRLELLSVINNAPTGDGKPRNQTGRSGKKSGLATKSSEGNETENPRGVTVNAFAPPGVYSVALDRAADAKHGLASRDSLENHSQHMGSRPAGRDFALSCDGFDVAAAANTDVERPASTLTASYLPFGLCEKPELLMPSKAQLLRPPCSWPWSFGCEPVSPSNSPRGITFPHPRGLPTLGMPPVLTTGDERLPGSESTLVDTTSFLVNRLNINLPPPTAPPLSGDTSSGTDIRFNDYALCPARTSAGPCANFPVAAVSNVAVVQEHAGQSVTIHSKDYSTRCASEYSNVSARRFTNIAAPPSPCPLLGLDTDHPVDAARNVERLVNLSIDLPDILNALREGNEVEADQIRQGVSFFDHNDALNALVILLPEQESESAPTVFLEMHLLGLILPVATAEDLRRDGCRPSVQYKFCLGYCSPNERTYTLPQRFYASSTNAPMSRESCGGDQNGTGSRGLAAAHSTTSNVDLYQKFNDLLSDGLPQDLSGIVGEGPQRDEARTAGRNIWSPELVLRTTASPYIVVGDNQFVLQDESPTSSGCASPTAPFSPGHSSPESSRTSNSSSTSGEDSMLSRCSSSTLGPSLSVWRRSAHNDECVPGEHGYNTYRNRSDRGGSRSSNREYIPSDTAPPKLAAPANSEESIAQTADRLWSTTVGKDVAALVTGSELRRQEAIFELIESEKEYLRDLELLRDHFMLALLTSAVPRFPVSSRGPPPPHPIEKSRRLPFVSGVFGNLKVLIAMHKRVLRHLEERQRKFAIVDGIGDILLRYTADFQCYLDYAPVAINGKEILEQEMKQNPGFCVWLEHFERHPVVRKLSLDSFRFRPLQRLARYPLLINEILKYTPAEGDDTASAEFDVLSTAMHMIRAWLDRTDEVAGRAKDRLRLQQIHDRLTFKAGESVDLGLLEDDSEGDSAHPARIGGVRPEREGQAASEFTYSVGPRCRQLLREGILKYRHGPLGEYSELQVFLFDNVLLFTKKKKIGNHLEYRVYKRPIPLELLIVEESLSRGLPQCQHRQHHGCCPSNAFDWVAQDSYFVDQPFTSVSTKVPIPAIASPSLITPPPVCGALRLSTSGATHTANILTSSAHGYPFLVRRLGRRGWIFQLHAASQSEREGWRVALEDAVRQRVLAVRPIQPTSQEWNGEFECHTIIGGRKDCDPNCSSLFDRGRKILLGTNDGVYMSQEGDNASLRRVISLDKVTYLGVMEEAMLLFVLADKALLSFSLVDVNRVYDELVSSASSSRNPGSPPWRKIATGVSYFNVGTCKGRPLVVHHKAKGLNSHFKVLEPAPINEARERKGISRLLSGTTDKPVMTLYREFYVPAQSWSVQFLRSQLCVVSERGFEVIGLDVQKTTSVPHESVQICGFDIQKLRPMSLFRLREGEFLLCYDEIAFAVDQTGRRKRPEFLIIWESEPTAFALYYPFVIAFDSTFIEVRHVETGRLVQAIAANNLRCLNTATDALHCVQQDRKRAELREIFKVLRREESP